MPRPWRTAKVDDLSSAVGRGFCPYGGNLPAS